MQTKIKKSNMILGVLFMTFVVVSASFVFDIVPTTSIFTETPGPLSVEIREHDNKPLSHGAPPAVGCADCHIDQLDVYQITEGADADRTWCTVLCHYSGGMAMELPTTFGGATSPGQNVTMPHHLEDNVRPGFNSCLSGSCHEDPDHPDDMRYIIIVNPGPGHESCRCHAFSHGEGP